MVRLRSFLVVLSLVIAADVTVAEASSAGSKCTKVGLVKRSTSGNLQCKKSGSKLVWMPQRSTKTVVTTTTTVAPTVAAPAVPTGWSDVETYASGVSYASWKASAAAIAAGTSKMPTPRYLTGPNVVITNSAPETAINLASRLFSSAAQPTQLTIMRYGYADVDWASSQWTGKFSGQDSSVGSEIANGCSTPTTCWGGVARSTSSGEAWISLATMTANTSSSRHVTGAIEAHEFVHNIQSAQFAGVTGRSFNYLPRWLLEGMASYSQAAVLGATSFDAYKAERTREVSGFKNSVAWLETFLAPTGTDWRHWNSYTGNDSWRIYDVGFLATEVLVALKGPATAMQLYSNVAGGQTFDAAFASLYGISWAEAYKKIARTIALQIGTAS
jgi:hypothetical protein